MKTWWTLALFLAACGAAALGGGAASAARAQSPEAIFGAIAGAAAGAIIANQARPHPYYAAPPGYYYDAPPGQRRPRKAAAKKPRKPAATQAGRSDPFANAGARAGSGGAVPARFQ